MKNLFLVVLILCAANTFAAVKTWVGTTDVYGLAGNWSPNGVPGSNDDLIINTAADYPYISSTRTVKSIKFAQAGAHIKLKPGINFIVKDKVENTSGSIYIIVPDGSSYGPLKISHTLSSTCDFIGDMLIPQLDLSTSNGDIRLSGCNLQILEWLKINNGTLDVYTGSLTTLADAVQTAYIHQDVGTTITGDVTIQQYVHAESGGSPIKTYHSISSPCANQTVGSFSDDATSWNLWPSENYPWPSAPGGTPPDFMEYDETVEDVIGSDQFYGYNNLFVNDNGDPLLTAKGYYIRIKPIGDIVDWTGSVNEPIDYMTHDLTWTNNNEPANDGFNMIGNPYPEPIDWNLFSAYPYSEIRTFISIWKNNGTEYYGAYATYDIDSGTALNGTDEVAAGIIPIGQGFWVKVLSSAAPYINLTIEEGLRTGDLTTRFYKDKPQVKSGVSNKIGLTIRGQKTYDETVITLREDGSNGYNEAKDVDKMMNPYTNFYSVKDNNPIGINKLAFPERETTVPLTIHVYEPGLYTLSLSQFAFTDQYSYYFEDKADNTLMPILEGFSYQFTIANEKIDDRFAVRVVNKDAVSNIATTELHCFTDGQTLNVQVGNQDLTDALITVTDMSGKVLYFATSAMDAGKAQLDVSTFAKGMYLVNVKHSGNNETQKVFIAQ